MGEGLIWLTSIGGYVGVAATAYRVQYVKTYKAYRRWQAEKPKQIVNLDYDVGYSFVKKERQKTDYWEFFKAPGIDRVPPPYLVMWPILLVFWVFWKFMHPDVKVPDIQRINTLEKELRELED